MPIKEIGNNFTLFLNNVKNNIYIIIFTFNITYNLNYSILSHTAHLRDVA